MNGHISQSLVIQKETRGPLFHLSNSEIGKKLIPINSKDIEAVDISDVQPGRGDCICPFYAPFISCSRTIWPLMSKFNVLVVDSSPTPSQTGLNTHPN